MKRLAIVILIVCVFGPHSLAFAQTDNAPEDIISSGIIISTIPENPGPDTTISVRLDSSTTDLDQSKITWSINGSKVASGQGVRTVEASTGPDGSQTVISVTVDSPDGTFTKSLTLEGGSVDLLWQGEGYAPPFYEGRTLWGYMTRATLLAIPHVSGRTTADLSFRWKRDGTVLAQSSGAGKNSLTVFDTILGLPQTISVDVMTDSNTIAASAEITLTPQAPVLHVYENDPLLGFRFEREVGNGFSFTDKEVTFGAFPFFFGVTKRNNSDLVYNWLANGGNAKIGNEVTYRAPASTGSSAVSASAASINQALQTAQEDFLVQFSNNND